MENRRCTTPIELMAEERDLQITTAASTVADGIHQELQSGIQFPGIKCDVGGEDNSIKYFQNYDTKTSVITLNTSKAGMGGLNVEKINQIISAASEGSKFYEHKRKLKERMDKKAADFKQQYENLHPTVLRDSEKKVDRIASELQASQDNSRIIVHIDMDSFFASVEMRDNPSLAMQPMAVGCNSMLSTSNYIARKFGVRAAMPGFIAKKLCPNLIIVPPDFEKYSAASKLAHEIYKEYDSNCYSCMDEASLDLTMYIQDQLTVSGETREVELIESTVREIREKVRIATNGLTCSAGISPVGFLSKICSDINKPNGQYWLPTHEIPNFIRCLQIRKVCGIGEATETLLKSLGIETCGDIWERRGAISLLFKPTTADFLFRVALGVSKHFFAFPTSSDNSVSDDRKSISCERTFAETGSLETISQLCLHICRELAQHLKSKDCKARSVAVKIKTDMFDVRTRIRTILEFTSDPDIIYKTAISVFESLRIEQEELVLRLFGVRVSSLQFGGGQGLSRIPDCGNDNSAKQFWDKFLGSSEKEQPTFACPLCHRMLKTFFAFQKHVNECLDRSEQVEPSVTSSKSNISKSSCTLSSSRPPFSRFVQDDKPSKRLKTTAEFYTHNSLPSLPSQNTLFRNKTPSTIPSSSKTIKMMPLPFYFQNESEVEKIK